MKKNKFSDNQSGKNSKGFYAALGISAVMIGSACFFAYNQNDKLTDSDNIVAENSENEAAVDHKVTNIPKTTSPAITTTTTTAATVPATTTAAVTTTHIATVPAAAIGTAVPPSAQPQTTTKPDNSAGKLTDVTAPLADISKIITQFSGKELVKSETTGSWQTHNGTDIAAKNGDEVFAVSTGEVTAVNEDPLWGITVVIDHHNGYISKYCGLASDLSVQPGDTIVSGNTIGVIGDTADIESALEPHLHIEILHNGSYIDPLSVLNS